MNEEYKFSGETLSCWTNLKPFNPSVGNTESAWDVAVVGGGIAGLCTAYLLAKEGRLVTVLDAASICSGQTSRTTAHLAFAMDDRIHDLIDMHGPDKTRMVVESHAKAIDLIESIIKEENIQCDFERVDGYLFLKSDQSPEYLNTELKSCREIGLNDVSLEEAPPDIKAGKCLKFPRQAQMHPLKFAFGLASAIERMGGRIAVTCRVENIEDGIRPKILISNGTVIEANQVVVATNSPINNRFAIHTKQAPYRTYVVGGKIPKNSVRHALYWDTEDPYHYVRVVPGEGEFDTLIVGGEDHKTGQDEHPERHFVNLQRWAKTHFPQIQEFTTHWSGQVWEPADSLAFIGRSPGEENVFLVTGDSGQGMTYGMVAGMILTDLLQSRENEWVELYEPSRVMSHGALDYIKENLNTAWQYVDYLRPSEVDVPNRIPLCKGAVIRRGTKHVAVYRRIDGSVVERSAVCTHLGGIVHWNSVEKSWDCPCHGSRFNTEGEVITGPAVEPLATLATVPDTFADTGEVRRSPDSTPPETHAPPG